MASNGDHDYPARKRVKCFTRNAIVARENRLKKKEYLTTLEENVSRLSRENVDLKQRLENSDEKLKEALQENQYLRSVLANRKEIEKLLRVVKIGTGLDVTSSLKHCPCPGLSPPAAATASLARHTFVSDRKACRLHLPIDADQKLRSV